MAYLKSEGIYKYFVVVVSSLTFFYEGNNVTELHHSSKHVNEAVVIVLLIYNFIYTNKVYNHLHIGLNIEIHKQPTQTDILHLLFKLIIIYI